jgi:hypothetical protein
MRNVSKESCREKSEHDFMFNKVISLQSCRLRDNVEKYGTAGQTTDGNITWRIACWTTKATDTHSEYVIFIAFPRQ